MENLKVYVDVLVKMDKDGDMTPVEFVWEDGTTYQQSALCQPEGGRYRNPVYRYGRRKRMPFIL